MMKDSLVKNIFIIFSIHDERFFSQKKYERFLSQKNEERLLFDINLTIIKTK